MELVARELSASGVAGETHLMQLLYLAVTSRLLDRPCSVAVKGPSAGGKSYVVRQVLGLFPQEAYYELTGMSEHALAYDTESLVHRFLVVYEAAGVSSETANYFMRSLLSEGRIDYVTVVKGKGGPVPRRIVREGPTGLITTTTAVALDPETETRLLTLTVTDSAAQTRAIMLAHARGTPMRDRQAWHDLQRWLSDSVIDVVVPYAETLAEVIPPVAVRLRRDFPTLITLLRAHALLHQLHRQHDAAGRVYANFEDYSAVRSLLADLLADATERAVPAAIRETVGAVRDLTGDQDPLGEGVPATSVATRLDVDKSTALRRLRVAAHRGYVKNLEPRTHRPGRYIVGDPLPDDVTLLPTTAALERLHGCSGAEGNTDFLDLAYPPGATDPDGDADEPALVALPNGAGGAEP